MKWKQFDDGLLSGWESWLRTGSFWSFGGLSLFDGKLAPPECSNSSLERASPGLAPLAVGWSGLWTWATEIWKIKDKSNAVTLLFNMIELNGFADPVRITYILDNLCPIKMHQLFQHILLLCKYFTTVHTKTSYYCNIWDNIKARVHLPFGQDNKELCNCKYDLRIRDRIRCYSNNEMRTKGVETVNEQLLTQLTRKY